MSTASTYFAWPTPEKIGQSQLDAKNSLQNILLLIRSMVFGKNWLVQSGYLMASKACNSTCVSSYIPLLEVSVATEQ